MSAAWAEVVTACDALSQLVTSSTIGAAAVTQRRNTANRRDTGGVQIDVRSDLNCEDDDGFNFGRDGEAQVAECDYTSGAGTKRVTRRLVVRRTRLTRKTQQKLWPDWRHHAFLTDLNGDVIAVDRFHRKHATVELAIKDLKAGAGLEHLPSGVFWANSAWFQIAILAHNMCRWTARLGGHDTDRLIVARTIRTRLLALPGRLVNRAGQPTLQLPSRWSWAHTFTKILDALRALEPVPT